MSVDLGGSAKGRIDVPRDEPWGRPLIIPVGGGKLTPYTRATTWAGTLEDRYNLGRWEMRQVALGLAARKDLIMKVSSLGTEPSKIAPEYKAWRAGMDATVDHAKEAAKSSQWANIGDALHSYTEKLDLGLDLGHVPDEYAPHIKAYGELTKDFECVAIERFMVNDEFKIGGTPDRIFRVPGHDKLIIGDVKSGNTEFGVGKIAIQLGIYAHCVYYDPSTGRRSSPGEVDQDIGCIIALNAQTGECVLKWIDIAAGWQAVSLADQVRTWRRRKNYSVAPPVDHAAMIDTPPMMDPVNAALERAIDQASDAEELITLWRAAGPRWTPHHTALAAERKAVLAKAS